MIQDTVHKLKAAIIGCGRISSYYEDILDTQKPHSHAGAFENCDEIDLVAASDISEKARSDFRKRWDVNTFESYQKMLEETSPDVVSICTPPEMHYDQIKDIINNFKCVKVIWCEKPISTSVEESIELKALSESSGVKIAVNTWRRWDQFHRKITEIIHSGRIGDVYLFNCKAHVGIMNTCSHLFDLVLMYSKSESESVFAKLSDDRSCDPGVVGSIELESGVTVFVDNAWKKDQEFGMFIQGEKGSISAFSNSVLLDSFTVRDDKGETTYRREDFKYKSPMLCAVNDIVQSIKSEKDLLTDISDSVEVMKIISACYQSSATGRAVRSVQPEFINMKFKSRKTSLTKSGRLEE